MPARLSTEERLRRAVSAFLRHTKDHRGGFQCRDCAGFRSRLELALAESERQRA